MQSEVSMSELLCAKDRVLAAEVGRMVVICSILSRSVQETLSLLALDPFTVRACGPDTQKQIQIEPAVQAGVVPIG